MNTSKWKFPFLYLNAVGIANVGGWIYLLAINLIIFDKTGSALAVAALYMIRPFASILTGLWAGSVIDRVSTKHLMITLDVIRAILILLIPMVESIWIIYTLVLFIQVAGAIFEPASFTYMTLLLPEQDRNRFNALLSFVHSGAFIIGPLVAGVLFMIGTLIDALYVNVGIFITSAGLTVLLPKISNLISSESKKISPIRFRNDWVMVWNFSKKALPFVMMYFVFQGVLLLTAALDSMEIAFAKEVLHLSDAVYGSLVSVAGIGFLLGAVCTNVLVRFTSTELYMSIGALLMSIGYILYSLSTTFILASIGFFILSFFLAIANTGFMTFIQSNVPINMMGRISSLYEMVSSSIQILAVLFIGLAGEWLSVKEVVILGAVLMFGVACYLTFFATTRSKFANSY